jgi:hypothetical protein
MRRSLKILLTASLVCLAAGTFFFQTRRHIAPEWALALPVGATLAGLFLISFIFRNERSDAEDREKRREIETAGEKVPGPKKLPARPVPIKPHGAAFG